MSKFIYPSNLYDIVEKRWITKTHQNENFLPLPSKEVFNQIIDVAYHASFLTEEKRRIWFKVIYLSPEEFDEGKIINANSIRCIKFSKLRVFNQNELIKLAPAADPTQVLIALSLFNNNLKIWGLLEAGTGWWDLRKHEATIAPTPPNAFTISSKSPGQITISRSGKTILALSNGTIIETSSGVFKIRPVANFLKWGAEKFRTDLRNLLQKEGIGFVEKVHFSGVDYSVFLERVLNRIREKSHGGTLVIIPDEIDIDNKILKERVIIKYSCQFDALNLLVKKKARDIMMTKTFTNISEKKEAIDQNQFSEYFSQLLKQEEAANEVKRAAWFISSLSAVDGAVIITDKLRLLGFGAELIADSKDLESVKIITDFGKNLGENKKIELFGTRHRSAFRFCSSLENAVAFIVSQDGDFRVAKRVRSEVCVWPILDGTALAF